MNSTVNVATTHILTTGVSNITSIPISSGPSLVDLGKRLLEASKRGDTNEIRTLMSSGAPFTTDWLGTSPLHFAAQNGHVETVTILLRAGISRDARTKVDRTPLHAAAQAGHFEIVQLLLKHSAIVNALDMLKMTPLHWAVENGHTNTVNLLLKHGADASCIDKFDRTPMDIALGNMQMDIVELLQNAHPPISQLSSDIIEEEVQTDIISSQSKSCGDSIPHVIAEEVTGGDSGEDNSQSAVENGSDNNTSYLAALAALAEATATSGGSSDSANWLSNRSISVSSAGTPFTLTEAGKLALTNFVKSQGVHEGNTVVTIVTQDGNQVLVVQQQEQEGTDQVEEEDAIGTADDEGPCRKRMKIVEETVG